MPLLYFLLPVAWSKWDWNILPGENGVWRHYLVFAIGDVSSLLEDRAKQACEGVLSCCCVLSSLWIRGINIFLSLSGSISSEFANTDENSPYSWVIYIYKHLDCVEQVILTTSYQNHDEGTIILETETTKLYAYICTK